MARMFPVILCLGLVFGSPAWAQNAASIEATLNAHTGKRVTLRLDDGGELTGTLAATSPVTVRLTELAGKEFFDAVVRIDRISAVVYRAREK